MWWWEATPKLFHLRAERGAPLCNNKMAESQAGFVCLLWDFHSRSVPLLQVGTVERVKLQIPDLQPRGYRESSLFIKWDPSPF